MSWIPHQRAFRLQQPARAGRRIVRKNRTRFFLDVIDRIRKSSATRCRSPRDWASTTPSPTLRLGVDKNDYTKPDLNEPRKLIALLRHRGRPVIDITSPTPIQSARSAGRSTQPIAGGYPEPEHPPRRRRENDRLTARSRGNSPTWRSSAPAIAGWNALRQLWRRRQEPGPRDARSARAMATRSRLRTGHPPRGEDASGEGLRRVQRVFADHADGGQPGCVVRR